MDTITYTLDLRINFLLAIILGSVLFFGCRKATNPKIEYTDLIRTDITLCGTTSRLSGTSFGQFGKKVNIKPFDPNMHPRLLGKESDLPLISANDNCTPAGKMVDGVLEIELEVAWGDFRVETKERTGLRVVAIAESGKAPSIPGPLIRVETGTKINVHFKNILKDSTITVFGLHSRPAESPDSLVIEPGKTKSVLFEAGEAGTYYYTVRLGAGISFDIAEEEQLAGAFIVDPKGGSPPDRIFMMNIFSTKIDTALHAYGWLETLTINGLSFPFTERLRPTIGDTLRWRIINATQRNHPMHLHGFFYDVTAKGDMLKDNVYDLSDRRSVVTEFMLRKTTMSMEWIPTRAGNWLFHCHLSFHVAPDIRLPGSSEADDPFCHMAGLVLGIEIPPGPTDLISKGEPLNIDLYANDYDTASGYNYGFTLDSDYSQDVKKGSRIGPLLLLKQYQTTYITIENNMSIPTGVHWHGLELDSWSDGVPEWSSSDGMVSPTIYPGEKFTYKLSLMRAGSFIYHSHLDDITQLTEGLYGPLIVIGENDTYDPKTDHYYLIGWKNPDPLTAEEIELNGRSENPPLQQAVVGETHRIRLMHIAPAGIVFARMTKDNQPVPMKYIAKDGRDLPEHQQVLMEETPKYGVGETADFAFTPTEPGTYELYVGYAWAGWKQTWEVSSKKN